MVAPQPGRRAGEVSEKAPLDFSRRRAADEPAVDIRRSVVAPTGLGSILR
jgi:hypothetical protein